MTTNHGSIVIVSEAAAAETLAHLKTFVQEHSQDFQASKVYVSSNSTETTSNDVRVSFGLSISDNPSFRDVDDILLPVFQKAMQQYRLALPALLIDVTTDEGYQIIKYEVGGKYGLHCDDHNRLVRRVSGLLYLNDDYEGGELRFPVHNLTIKPKAGDVILFPSGFEYPHESCPVTKGTKLAVTTWFR